MFTQITYKNKFGIDLNTIVHGDAMESGLLFDKLRLKQFLATFEDRINEDNLQFLEAVKNEKEDIRLSILSQFNIDNSLNYFKDLLLKSVFISSYAMFENRIIKTCEICMQHNDIVPYKTFRKKKGNLSEFETAVAYLGSEMKINTNTLLPDINILLEFKDIRTAIIHRGSEIDISKLYKFSFKDSGLVNNDGILKFNNRKFVEKFIDLSCDFICRIIEKMNIELELVERRG